MENEFTELEIALIEKEATRKPYSEIAFLLDRTVKEVKDFISVFFKDREIVLFQSLLDEKKKTRPSVIREPRPSKGEKKKPRKISRIIQQENKAAFKNTRGGRVYFDRQVDYSKLITVRIDDKTFVYAQPGEDPDKVREKYFHNLTLPKQISPSQRNKTLEVKKFKPVK
jgi:hypothetical protein